MATQAEREQQRRHEIEKAYVQPEPVHDWAPAAPTDRPSKTVDAIIIAARDKGWTVVEMTRYDWHPPTWTTDPDGGPATYGSRHRVQYGLFVHHPLQNGAPTPGLAGVLINFVDGTKKGTIGLGYGRKGTWTYSTLATTSVAKLIREEGIQA